MRHSCISRDAKKNRSQATAKECVSNTAKVKAHTHIMADSALNIMQGYRLKCYNLHTLNTSET